MLNPLMKYFQNKFKLNRILSIILTYIIVIGLLTLFINTFVPKIIKMLEIYLLTALIILIKQFSGLMRI